MLVVRGCLDADSNVSLSPAHYKRVVDKAGVRLFAWIQKIIKQNNNNS